MRRWRDVAEGQRGWVFILAHVKRGARRGRCTIAGPVLILARRLMRRGGPCGVGWGGVCDTRMTLQERSIGTCRGAAGEEDAPPLRRHGLVGIVGGRGADGRHSGLGGGELSGGRRGIGTLGLALLLSLVGRSVLHELPSGTACKKQYKEVTYCTIGPTGQNFLALWHEPLVSATLAARYLLRLFPAIPRLRASLQAVGIASSRVSGSSNSSSKSILTITA